MTGTAEPPLSEPPLVELRDVGVRFPGRPEPALSRVSLTVRRGELITLIAASGSGMSTLLSVIGLIRKPTAGTYLFDGRDTARLGERQRAAIRGRLIGSVFQRPHLLPFRSALDNVMLPLVYAGVPPRQRRQAAMSVLERVGLAGLAQLPVSWLSESERQRLSIARALAAEPALLLADDPTSGLDPAGAAQVVGLLVGLHAAGRTVLVATGDQLAAAHSSRRVTLGLAGSPPEETGAT